MDWDQTSITFLAAGGGMIVHLLGTMLRSTAARDSWVLCRWPTMGRFSGTGTDVQWGQTNTILTSESSTPPAMTYTRVDGDNRLSLRLKGNIVGGVPPHSLGGSWAGHVSRPATAVTQSCICFLCAP